MRLCPKSKKRMYRSSKAALRAGSQRYGTSSNTYRCFHCSHWHLTRRDVPVEDSDPQIDQLVDVALGKGSGK